MSKKNGEEVSGIRFLAGDLVCAGKTIKVSGDDGKPQVKVKQDTRGIVHGPAGGDPDSCVVMFERGENDTVTISVPVDQLAAYA